MGEVKFIRRNGRIIPIRGKGSAPKGVSKRYGAKREKPKVHGLTNMQRNAVTATGAAVGALKSRGRGLITLGGGIIIGGAIANLVSATTFSKRGKGESKKQLARRVANKNRSGV